MRVRTTVSWPSRSSICPALGGSAGPSPSRWWLHRGKQVLAVVNFPPRQIANFFSEILVLGTYSEGGVVLITPDKPVKNGDKLG